MLKSRRVESLLLGNPKTFISERKKSKEQPKINKINQKEERPVLKRKQLLKILNLLG